MAWQLVGTTKLGSFHQLEVWLEQRTQNIANNNTVVAYEFGIRRTSTNGGAYWTTNTNNSAWLTVDGTNIPIANFAYDFRNSTYKVLASSTRTVPHEADGSKSVYINGTIQIGSGLLPGGNANGTLWLTTIPRASSLGNVSGNVIGSAVSVPINRASTSFTHTVKFVFGSYSQTLTGQTTSAGFTPPLDWCKAIPNSTSGTGTVYLTTYNGSTQIGGTVSKTFTLNVPNSVWPSFSHISHKEYVADVLNKVGVYVQGKSRLTLTINGAAGSYGSTIKTYKITFAGHTINSSSGTTGVVNQSGNLTATATVTDSRGRSAQASLSINVLAYSAPKLTSARFERCTSNGTIDALGTYVKVTFSGTVSSLINGTQKNKLMYVVKSKRTNEGSFTVKSDLLHNTLSYSGSQIFSGYPVDYSYNFTATITDIFSGTVSAGIVPVGEVLMHWHKSSMAIGMMLPDTAHNLYVGQKGIRSEGAIYQNGTIPVQNGYMGLLPSGTNLNDKDQLKALKPGVYWSVQSDGVIGKPSDWGFMTIPHAFVNSDGFAIWKHQSTGDFYWTSWNAQYVTGWRRFIDSNNLLTQMNNHMADRVVDEGSTGIWAWRKWNSGRCEMWGTLNRTLVVGTAWGNIYSSGSESIPRQTLPFTVNNTRQYVSCSSASYSGMIMTNSAPTSTQTSPCEVVRATQAPSLSWKIDYHIQGNWK